MKAVNSWAGKENAGILVKWAETGDTYLYRWDVAGSFDIKVVGKIKPFPPPQSSGPAEEPHVAISQDGGVVAVAGCKVSVSLVLGLAEAAPDYQAPGKEFKFCVTCVPTLDKSKIKTFTKELALIEARYNAAGLKHDLALMDHVNKEVVKKKMNLEKLLSCCWADLCPKPDDLIALPILKELVEFQAPAPAGANADGGECTSKLLQKSAAQARFQLLLKLNASLQKAIPYVDLSLVNRSWSLASLLSQCRGLIFSLLKEPLWDRALQDTQSPASIFDLKLSRSRAANFSASNKGSDTTGRFMVFSQATPQFKSEIVATIFVCFLLSI